MQKMTVKLLEKRSRERELVCEILKDLAVVERTQVFLQEGCSSMFAYCTEIMGYSEDEAFIRIQAMRGLRAMPSVEEKLERGEIKLTVLAKAHAAIRRTEKVRKVTQQEKTQVIDSLMGATVRQADVQIATVFPESVKPVEKIRPVSDDLVKFEFFGSRELAEKLERLKGLTAHKNYDGRLDVLVNEMADIALTKLDPIKNNAPVPVSNGRTRYIAKGARRVVWQRAGSRCEYVDKETGRRCSSQHGLQIDHIHEFANGGRNGLQNLRLLCGPHNRWRSKQ